jgi:O-acetyl-ADP-ribose deacetylase (regulator of RNase III)
LTVEYIKGNIFTSRVEVLVNPVNCVGVMGAGLALEFRLRYPEMYSKYREICNKNLLKPGLLWLYKSENIRILNFPTKNNWKNPSKEKYLIDGLKKFTETYEEKKIKSIAFPLLGADKGGLKKEKSLDIMMHYLNPLDLEVKIYEYDDKAYDDVFFKIKSIILNTDLDHLSNETKIRRSIIDNILKSISDNNFYQVNQLLNIDEVGVVTLEKIYQFCTKQTAKGMQRNLF